LPNKRKQDALPLEYPAATRPEDRPADALLQLNQTRRVVIGQYETIARTS